MGVATVRELVHRLSRQMKCFRMNDGERKGDQGQRWIDFIGPEDGC